MTELEIWAVAAAFTVLAAACIDIYVSWSTRRWLSTIPRTFVCAGCEHELPLRLRYMDGRCELCISIHDERIPSATRAEKTEGNDGG